MEFGGYTPTDAFMNPHTRDEVCIFHFENGYGANIARGPYTYGGPKGLWELAVTKKTRDGWDLCYDTPITHDVMNMEYDDVVNTLEDISCLSDDYDLLHKSFVDHDGNVVFVD